MAASLFKIKQNDTSDDLGGTAGLTLKDGDNNAVDITGASVVFSMRKKRGTPPKVVEQSATVVDAANGKVKYSWSVGDTDTPGEYTGEFEVTYGGGGIQTFPNNKADELTILIEPEIA